MPSQVEEALLRTRFPLTTEISIAPPPMITQPLLHISQNENLTTFCCCLQSSNKRAQSNVNTKFTFSWFPPFDSNLPKHFSSTWKTTFAFFCVKALPLFTVSHIYWISFTCTFKLNREGMVSEFSILQVGYSPPEGIPVEVWCPRPKTLFQMWNKKHTAERNIIS